MNQLIINATEEHPAIFKDPSGKLVAGRVINGHAGPDGFRTPAEMETQAREAMLSGDFERAEHLYRLRLDHGSENPQIQLALAMAIGRQGRIAEALAACPKNTQDGCLLAASIFEDINDQERSRRAIERGLVVDPKHPELNFALGCQALRVGDWKNGWAGHEHRPTHAQLRDRLDEIPEWDGKPSLKGRKLLIAWEMGFGDQIMFARWIPEAMKRGNASVVLLTRPQLARLFDRSGMDRCAPRHFHIVTDDRQVDPTEIGAWIGIGSLPHVLGADGNIPVPLHIEDLPSLPYRITGSGLRVGLCWQGSREHQRDQFRSIPPDMLRPLLDTPGWSFYNLQKDATGHGLADPMDYCHDLADTAALIRQLDLVITADTAILHLAGSLGVPTWGLLGAPSDWRWGVEGETTTWYPSVRLFRCAKPLEWEPVIENAGLALAERASTFNGAPDHQQAPVTHADIIAVNTRYGPMQTSTRDRWPGRSLIVYGEWSEGEVDLFREFIHEGDVVVEAGANVGSHTLSLARIVGPEGHVYAFEPNQETFRLLYANCEQVKNEGAVHMLMYAAGASSGECALACDPGNYCNANIIEGSGVQMRAVDSLNLERVDFLKSDVEGYELEVLKGAEQTIARCRPVLYVEDDRPEKNGPLIDWIHAQGYRMYQHYPRLYNPDNFRGYKVNVFGNIVSAMLLCVPNEKYFDLRLVEKLGLERVRVEQE